MSQLPGTRPVALVSSLEHHVSSTNRHSGYIMGNPVDTAEGFLLRRTGAVGGMGHADFVEVDSNVIERRVEVERIEQFFAREPLTSLSSIVPALYTAWAMRNDLPHTALLWWLGICLGTNALTLLNALLYRNLRPEDLRGPTARLPWLMRQVALRAGTNLVWGGVALIAPHSVSDAAAAHIGVVLVAVTGISAVGLLPLGRIVVLLLLLQWIFPVSFLAALPSERLFTLNIGIVVMLLSMNFYFWKASSHLVHSLEKRFEAAGLAERLEQASHRIHTLATFDELTETFNRYQGMRALAELCELELTRTQTPQQDSLYVMLLDIDYFKHVNDTHGHLAGDRVLRQVAALLQQQLSEPDILARIGGEEFLLIAPLTSTQRATQLSEELRSSIESAPIQIGTSTINVTTSIGVAALEHGLSLEQILHRADTALYQAKRQGRNCVVFAKNLPSALLNQGDEAQGAGTDPAGLPHPQSASGPGSANRIAYPTLMLRH